MCAFIWCFRCSHSFIIRPFCSVILCPFIFLFYVAFALSDREKEKKNKQQPRQLFDICSILIFLSAFFAFGPLNSKQERKKKYFVCEHVQEWTMQRNDIRAGFFFFFIVRISDQKKKYEQNLKFTPTDFFLSSFHISFLECVLDGSLHNISLVPQLCFISYETLTLDQCVLKTCISVTLFPSLASYFLGIFHTSTWVILFLL